MGLMLFCDPLGKAGVHQCLLKFVVTLYKYMAIKNWCEIFVPLRTKFLCWLQKGPANFSLEKLG